MDYEKKYKEALEWMRSVYDGLHGATKEDAEHYFPELKESKDERIRKAIHIYLDWLDGRKDYAPKGIYSIKDMIAWVEKQDGQKSVFEMKTPEESLGIDSDTYNKIVDECIYGEQKPADDVEPKFKVGDWVVNNVCFPMQIASIKDGMYIFTKGDAMSVLFIDGNFHLWTIEDAKDGDVLVSDEVIFIFNKIRDVWVSCHCSLHKDGSLCEENYDLMHIKYAKTTYPATKKQRDLFSQKMKEAGYEWDADKKELKNFGT